MRMLHVTNGSTTSMTMAEARIPGTYSIWADPLHDGPVPGGLSDAELLDVRVRHLGPADAPERDMRLWRAPLERTDAYDEIVLWFEHDLFDQLNLIQLLTWIQEHVPSSKAVSLICIDAFPGRTDFKGLGELQPHELASLLDRRQPVTAAQYELATRAWLAFRARTPEALDDLCYEETSSLPFLAPAVMRFLQEYPWTRDGLSRSERRLLTLSEGDGISLAKAFPRMHDGERAYYVTDVALVAMATELSLGATPLLTLEATNDGRTLARTVRLTPAGREVLSGRQDRVDMRGIERWLGGVHLHSDGPSWRWDDTARRVVLTEC